MLEIERKFLVKSAEFKTHAFDSSRIKQGYLNSDPERTVRVRIRDTEAYITVKGKSSESGLSRFEWEKQIPLEEAESLLEICESGMIDKSRFLVDVEGHIYEVDEFYGENKGLLLAEIELESEDEKFTKPDWLGEEVTGDQKYYNSLLAKNPFNNWKTS